MRALIAWVSLMVSLGCGPDGAPASRAALLSEHVPRIKNILQQDRQRHHQGIVVAADLVARGFLVEDPETRERQMRTVLRRIQEPAARGNVPHFVASPMTFLAAVGTDGIVIARDSDEDAMKGLDFGERYPVVRAALETGARGYALGEFASVEEGEPSSWSMLFVAPARHEGRVVGAVVAGIPLWRSAQRISRQLRVDHAPEIERGLTLWAYLYKGDRVFSSLDAPPELNEFLPDATARAAGLTRSPGGFTGEFQAYQRWYGFVVVPTPGVAEDVGMIVVRGEPPL
ncbi:MAG: hypothetical protein KF901_13615 [Myxococcales bacterium]|nr:hypothetical protein [Myxococcales bacterium]